MSTTRTGSSSSSTTPSHNTQYFSDVIAGLEPYFKEYDKTHNEDVEDDCVIMAGAFQVLRVFKHVADDSISLEMLAKRVMLRLGILTVEQDDDEGIVGELHSSYSLPAGRNSSYKPCPLDARGRPRSPTPPPPEVPTYLPILRRVTYPDRRSHALPLETTEKEITKIKIAKAKAEVYGTPIPPMEPPMTRTHGGAYVLTLDGPCMLRAYHRGYEDNLTYWLKMVNERRQRDGIEETVTVGLDYSDNQEVVKRKFQNEEEEGENDKNADYRPMKKLRRNDSIDPRAFQTPAQSTSTQPANSVGLRPVRRLRRSESMIGGSSPLSMQPIRRHPRAPVRTRQGSPSLGQSSRHGRKLLVRKESMRQLESSSSSHIHHMRPAKHRRVVELIHYSRMFDRTRIAKASKRTSSKPTAATSASSSITEPSPESASTTSPINPPTPESPTNLDATGFFDRLGANCSIQ